MTDQGFPLIEYVAGKTPLEWGQQHGESFRAGIKELVEIRTELMLAKNPSIKYKLDELALGQWNISKDYAPLITQEMEGIYQGAGITLTDVVILNNYTDFRDLTLPEEGCSTIHVQQDKKVYSGQTWDMHGTAKKYVSLVKTPTTKDTLGSVNFSLVGCVGMMGVNSHSCLVGVNNINTANAEVGLIWPLLVRKALTETKLAGIKERLFTAPVTSGHNYLCSSIDGGAHLEITPEFKEEVLQAKSGENQVLFHTNHCLGEKVKTLEDQSSLSSTTHARYKILEGKSNSLDSLDSLVALLTDHDEFPKSICSHFESGAQDPSFTCGGGAADLSEGANCLSVFWRGCEVHDDNFKKHSFKLVDTEFGKDFQRL
jgi:isopenicillin-N N-acyltransferase like protein